MYEVYEIWIDENDEQIKMLIFLLEFCKIKNNDVLKLLAIS